MATTTRVVRSRRSPTTDEPGHQAAPREDGHTRRMLTHVIKSDLPVIASQRLEDPFDAMYGDGGAYQPQLDPEALLVLADENSAHGACLDAKSDDAVGRGWTLEPQRTTATAPTEQDVEEGNEPDTAPGTDDAEEGDEVEAKRDELSQLLEDLTPDLTFDELLWAVSWEQDAVGWAAIEVARQNGSIAALFPIPAHTIRKTKDPDVYVQIVGGVTTYFARFGLDGSVDRRSGAKYDKSGKMVSETRGGSDTAPSDEDKAHECLWFAGYSPRSRHYPIPRWAAAIPAIAELTAIREFNVGFYGSGGMVDRIIHATAKEQAEAETLAATIASQVEDATGEAHLSLITGGSEGSDVKVLFLTPTQGRRDGQFGARRAELVEEVLMSHKVPTYRVARAITGALGGSPSREMLHTYRTGTVEPKQNLLESRLNATLFGPAGINLKGYKWVLIDLDWDETELDLQIATEAVDHAMATPNEGRVMLDMDKSDNPAMDQFYYKGVPVGQRQAPGAVSQQPAGANEALADIRSRARARREELAGTVPVAPVPVGATNGNGNGAASA